MSIFSRFFKNQDPSIQPNVHVRPPRPIGVEYWWEPGNKPEKGVIREVLGAWVDREVARRLTSIRELLLDPNRGSSVKIERYSFGINTTISLGVAGAPLTLTGQPDVNIRPQRIIMNAPSPGFAIIDEIKVANVSCTVGVQEDAYNYSAGAHNSHLDMPTLSPANRATVLGEMTGRVPEGFGFKNPTGPNWIDEREREREEAAAVEVPAADASEEAKAKYGEKIAALATASKNRRLGESYLFTCSFQGPASVIA